MNLCPLCGAELELLREYDETTWQCPIKVAWSDDDKDTTHYYCDGNVESYIAYPYYVLTYLDERKCSLISYWGAIELLLETPALTAMNEYRMRDKIKLLLTFS